MLNEIILPTAKRETSAQFRDTAMKDEGILKALADGREKLLKWYKDTTGNDEVALPLTPTPTPNPNPNPNPNPTPTPNPNPNPNPNQVIATKSAMDRLALPSEPALVQLRVSVRG